MITDVARGVRTSVRSNASAYGYSVMITATYGALSVTAPPPSLPRIFLFLAGAALAFSAIEFTSFFLIGNRVRPEPTEVVALGAAIGIVSISAGVGAATGLASLVDSWPAWFGGSAVATLVYLGVVAVELALAHRADEGRS